MATSTRQMREYPERNVWETLSNFYDLPSEVHNERCCCSQ